MHWVINYFTFHQRQWLSWTTDMDGGHLAYAERQSAMWLEMAQQARRVFGAVWTDFTKDSSVFT